MNPHERISRVEPVTGQSLSSKVAVLTYRRQLLAKIRKRNAATDPDERAFEQKRETKD